MGILGHKSKIIAMATCCLLSSNLTVKAESSFRDVSSGHWANEAVKNVSDFEIMRGDPSGNFSGTRTLNRYELAVVIDNLMQIYNEEFAADREDLANLVTIMEQFQGELRVLEKRTAEINDKLAMMQSGNSETDRLAEMVQENNESISNLKEKGFLVDTFVKGSYYDVKNVFGLKNRKKSVTEEVVVEAMEEAQEVHTEMIPAAPEPQVQYEDKETIMYEAEEQSATQRYDELYEESELIEELEESLGQ